MNDNLEVNLQLILGGARSGKSKLAESRAQEQAAQGKQKVYLATATRGDGEMSDRIAHHQGRRDDSWALVEEPMQLGQALLQNCTANTVVVVDCLTLWLSNCLHAQNWQEERQALFASFAQLKGSVLFVSNEVGLGVIPMGQITREFVDEAGFLHQELAQHCRRVSFCAAGLPVDLKNV